jgi:hypothetical protein
LRIKVREIIAEPLDFGSRGDFKMARNKARGIERQHEIQNLDPVVDVSMVDIRAAPGDINVSCGNHMIVWKISNGVPSGVGGAEGVQYDGIGARI